MAEQHSLLCLKCRGSGHNVSQCKRGAWQPELSWAFSEERKSMALGSVSTGTDGSVVCSRCESLDLIGLLQSRPPWNSQSELAEALDEETTESTNGSIRSLGKTGSVSFWADCDVCRCLFAITPNPSSEEQEVLLLPDWTICRVAGELGAKADAPEKRDYATCLLSVLRPSSISLPTSVVSHRGDALCLVESDLTQQRTLGGRQIHPHHEMNAGTVLGWIRSCAERHDESCAPVPTRELDAVRLIDVESRQVVRYPGPDCEYVALSYVWGNVTQDRYKLGDRLKELPRTLEDALAFTKRLGRRYLWADSVCIDQSDDDDKADQINRMWSIYRAAYVTVIALSGTSAHSGLSRFSRPDCYPQLRCRIEGKTLVSLMPTLSQQIWVTPWGRRAWTFQEGLLSPRCLYISDHQIYFDCSSMQCCESLDESRSWAHSLTPSSNPTEEGFVTWMLRQAGAGALRIPLDWPSRRLEHWGEKLNLYSYRTMRYAEDAIRAFAGVLQRLETIYPRGFFWGLPIEDFDWALLWRSQVPPTRREGFPTWSWAGWQGPLFFGQPIDVKKTRQTPTYLEISGYHRSGQLKQIFATRCDDTLATSSSHDTGGGLRVILRNDPIEKASRETLPEQESGGGPDHQHPSAEKEGHLSVTAVFLHLKPDFRTPRTRTYQAGQLATFPFRVREVQCYIRIMSTDRCIPGRWDAAGDDDDRWVPDHESPEEQEEWVCMLVARDHMQGFVMHHLMLVKMRKSVDSGEEVAERATVFELLVPLEDLDILEHFMPRKRRMILA
ncbi:heterokaryon incompatibility protein-domain-containing protein [Podospora didyma]|uniref:Heterokaryon incompatibility protein-domain-containing protein n=1 Tax=Podospora didyma TaxID=330526 RepID=A0AAE0P0L3_9PEZI|nr:heterokaryon incompatibility protein-domain-containing protein [Podospora didyma]